MLITQNLISSPPQFSTDHRTDDINALLNVIASADEFIYIAVMDYEPAIVYSYPKKYWPVIDDALRTAAYEKGIEVRLLGSHWEHSPCDMRSFLESLGSWNVTGPKNGSIKTKYFVVPPLNDTQIPYTRVNHNKYMVTDKAAYVGTSNWSGDYFISTGGVSCIVKKPNITDPDSLSIPEELKLVFERDWDSRYTFDINTVEQPPYCHDNK
uniref:PLD phosphodiesterase domain-containing protein n=1 Tax=Amphimedon queenslandica TaxID=400682 RepID=A0A1X7URW2_AMPQE